MKINNKIGLGMTKKVRSKTYIAVILDSSGSMASIKKQTVEHFNEQVQTIKKNALDQNVVVSLVIFNDEVKTKFWNHSVEHLHELKLTDYRPNSNTALYDAMGEVIEKLEGIKLNSKDAVLIIVISDGQENASKVYKGEDGREKLQSMIKRLTETNQWTFTYLGANQDLLQVARDLNIPVNNMQSFDATVVGMRTASSVTSSGLRSYLQTRSEEKTAVMDFYTLKAKK